MKSILTFIFIISTLCIYAQKPETNNVVYADSTKIVSFFTNFEESKMACKDGYAMNGYIVNISYDQAKKLDGKKIKVTGLFTIITGLKNLPKEYDKNGNEIIMQGRLNDIEYIDSPTIEIITK